MTSSKNSQIETLLQAIRTLEEQRDVLGEEMVQASIEAIQKQLDEFERSKQEVTQQRKLATILFSDIVGHTKLIQDLDPEINMEIIDGALVHLAAIVEANGGHIARFQGDGFKAIFGAPTAHESDPERAVCAGLGIIAAAQEYSRKLEAEWNLSGFNVRVGIDTGLVVVGGETEAEDTIKGLVVNLAARLESAAPPGGLLISHHTYQHVQGVFDVEAQEPILANGFPDPVPVFLVKGKKPRAFRMGTRGVQGIETKMVGREDDLEQLQTGYQMAAQQKQTTVITLVGEAGVGKSRLLFEIEKWLALRTESIHHFEGRAGQETQGIPQYLLRDMFATYFQILDSDSLDIVRQKFVSGTAAYFASKNEMKALILGTRFGYDFGESPELLVLKDKPENLKNLANLYLTEFFTAICTESPTVILLEDIHWSDMGSLDTLSGLVRELPQHPLLIICLARPILYERRPTWGENISNHIRLDLNSLSVADTNALVAEILHLVDPIPHALIELVSTRAEGNPFYAEELVKMLIDSGIIITATEPWHVAQEQIIELKVPSTLVGVLQARIDKLGSNEKLALQQASVIGRIFWDSALAALPNEGHLALPTLQAKEFIFSRKGSTFAGTIEYIFKHALLRDVAYETVLLRLRREYHARIARWIEQNAGDRLNEFCGLIAEHYTLAGAYVKAADFWEQAGVAAINTGNAASAQDAFELALKLLPDPGSLKLAELERKLAVILVLQRRSDEAETLFREALNHLDETPSMANTNQWQSTRLNILLGLSEALYFQFKPEAMAELSEQIQALLAEVGTAGQQSGYYGTLCMMAFLQNRFRIPVEDMHLVKKAMVYAQKSGNALRIAGQEFHLGFQLLWHGKLEEAVPMLTRALATSEALGDFWTQNQCLAYLVILYRLKGSTTHVAALMPRLIEISQELGNKIYTGVGLACKAWMHYHAAEWQQAQFEAEGALASWSNVFYPLHWLAHWPLLTIALHQNRLQDAVDSASAMLDPGQQQLPNEVEKVLGKAVAAWEANNESAAQSYLKTAGQLASQHGYL